MNRSVIATACFRPVPADLAAAQRAHLRWTYRRRSGFIAIVVIAIVLGGGIFAVDTEGGLLQFLLPSLFFIGMAFLIRLGLYKAMPLLILRTFRQQKNLHHEWRVELSADGARASTPNQDSFVAWSEDARVVLLYQSDRLFQFIQTPAFTPQGLAFFHEKVAALPRR
jgi:hypothetical protein